MSDNLDRTLTELASQIRELAKLTAEGIVEIGARLHEARRILKEDGRWLSWLSTEFQWTPQTAYNFMSAADVVKRNPNALRLHSPTLLYLLAGAPASAVDELIALDKPTCEQAKRIAKAHKWAARLEQEIAEKPDRTRCLDILRELDEAMKDDRRELALGIYRQYGSWLGEMTETDPIENLQDIGTTPEERHGPGPDGRVFAKVTEDVSNCKITVWVPDGDLAEPFVIATFPKTGNPVADSWRWSALEAAARRLGAVWEVK